jgi:hypothetical protein
MKIERHETGPRMSKAVIHGDTVYLAGIVADNPKGKSTAEQTRSILWQIDGFLATAGTNKNGLQGRDHGRGGALTLFGPCNAFANRNAQPARR